MNEGRLGRKHLFHCRHEGEADVVGIDADADGCRFCEELESGDGHQSGLFDDADPAFWKLLPGLGGVTRICEEDVRARVGVAEAGTV